MWCKIENLDDEKLEQITGGTSTISGTILNAFKGIIELLRGAGYAIGSGLRRIGEDNLCPLE